MQFQMMDRVRIQPSPLNPRKHFDPEKLQELAETMLNGVGIIEPLVVRSRPDLNCYELVAGERRWRAAAIALLDEVPVIVKELSDAQMLEIMVIENNQREDVSALEEADGFRSLMTIGGLDADKLAARLGRSVKYVYDRVKLFDMVPAGQQLLQQGRITAGHAILLARLKPEDQLRALDSENDDVWDHENALRDDDEEEAASLSYVETLNAAADDYDALKVCSVRELEAWIARHIRFNAFEMAAAAPLEYGDTAEAVMQAQAKTGRGKKVVAITFEYRTPDATRDKNERTYGENAWKRADAQGEGVCDFSVLGVVVGGRSYGRSFQVCVAREKCETHWKAEMRAREKDRKARQAVGTATKPGKSAEDSWQARQRKDREREEAEKKVWVAATPAIVEACLAKVKALKVPALVEVILRAEFLDRRGYTDALKHVGVGRADAETSLRALALGSVLSDISEGEHGYGRKSFIEFAKKSLGVDVAPLLKAAVQTSAPKAQGKTSAGKKTKKRAA